MGAYASYALTPHATGPIAALGSLMPDRLARRWMRAKLSTATSEWDGAMPFLEGAMTRRPPAAAPRRITHVIGTLGPGGAERQLCNLAIAQQQRGYEVQVMLLWDPIGEHGHYLPLLEAGGVEVRVAGQQFDERFIPALRAMDDGRTMQLPQECAPAAIDLFGEFSVRRPDLVHSWLDSPNISAGVGAVLAGVPTIVLSTRNVNPTHFPNLSRPYYRRAYQALAAVPGVEIINNSHNGAEDYARWLGIDRDRIAVVLNGLDFAPMTAPPPAAIDAFRLDLGLRPESRVIAGVFRLAEEKQPLVFLDVIEQVSRQVPDVVAVLAGIGPMETEVREHIAARALQSHVVMTGRLRDVRALYATADLSLLCSRQEGTPNVLLESQWFGCPVVSTRAGGAVEVVSDGVTGFLRDVGDAAGLTQAVTRLLTEPDLRRSMAARGPHWVQSSFSVDRMVKETLDVYGGVRGR